MVYFFLLLVIIGSACSKTSTTDINPIEKKIDSLLPLMTVEEKVGQLTLYTSDWDVTGPTIRAGYKEDIKSGHVGAIFNASHGEVYPRPAETSGGR